MTALISPLSQDEPPCSIEFQLQSPHKDQGYPGDLIISVIYTIKHDTLFIDYNAKLESMWCCFRNDIDALLDAKVASTIINLTNHSYFNLSGGLESTICQHYAEALADKATLILPLDSSNIPTGAVVPCSEYSGGVMSFSTEKQLGNVLKSMRDTKGLDHCFVVDSSFPKSLPRELTPCMTLTSPSTCIKMIFASTEPCFQFYTGFWIPPHPNAKKSQPGFPYGPFAGFCLEAQRPVDAIHHAQWQWMVELKANEEYHQSTSFSFSVQQHPCLVSTP